MKTCLKHLKTINSFKVTVHIIQKSVNRFCTVFLLHITPLSHPYKNQSMDLQFKSIDWFLYECIISLIQVTWVRDRLSQPVFNCSKSKMETLKHWRRSGVFIANFEQISHIVLRFPSLTLNKLTPVGYEPNCFTSNQTVPSLRSVKYLKSSIT